MPDYVVRRLMLALNGRGRPVSGSRILLLGLAYKKNTGDARESPAVRIAQLLKGMGSEAWPPILMSWSSGRLRWWMSLSRALCGEGSLFAGAGRGNRTPTVLSDLRILS